MSEIMFTAKKTRDDAQNTPGKRQTHSIVCKAVRQYRKIIELF